MEEALSVVFFWDCFIILLDFWLFVLCPIDLGWSDEVGWEDWTRVQVHFLAMTVSHCTQSRAEAEPAVGLLVCDDIDKG